ncbi:MAG TPA: SRPBCC family protein [Conexibacter sp.]
MARNEIEIEAPPEAVFDVLSDPRSFARWVVGSQAIRRADPEWPAPGAAFDHAVGIGPLRLKDHSRVVESARPTFLRMLVNARPLTQAWVTLRVRGAEHGRTVVEMDERAADQRSRLAFNPLTDPLIRLRNHESLRRLKALAEGHEEIPGGEVPTREPHAADGAVRGSSRPAAPG